MENTILQDGDSPERANASLDERRHGATFAMNSKRPSEECPPYSPTVGLSRTLFSLLFRHICLCYLKHGLYMLIGISAIILKNRTTNS